MVIPGEKEEKVKKQVNYMNSDRTHNHGSVPKCTRILACHFQVHLETPKSDLNHWFWPLFDLILADPSQNVYFPSKDLEW